MEAFFINKFSTFQRTVTFFVEAFGPYAHKHLVSKNKSAHSSMKRVHDNNKRISFYLEELYATDTIFQQPFCSRGTMKESNSCYSFKHISYGSIQTFVCFLLAWQLVTVQHIRWQSLMFSFSGPIKNGTIGSSEV